MAQIDRLELPAEDLEVLRRQTPETLAKWWCLLNSWEWPQELPNEETIEEYNKYMLKNGGRGVYETRRSRINQWIEETIGHRIISREWNRDRMTDEEFEDFWRGYYEGNAAAKAKAEARTWAEVYLKSKWPTVLYDEGDWPDEIEIE